MKKFNLGHYRGEKVSIQCNAIKTEEDLDVFMQSASIPRNAEELMKVQKALRESKNPFPEL